METRTDRLLKETAEVLEQNILDYWLEVETLPGVILNARVIWAFSAAYAALHRPEYLRTAERVKGAFMAHYIDPVNGGVYWDVDGEGKPLDDKKQLYAQGFAIYGLSEYYKVTGDLKALAAAAALFQMVEDHFADRENGGYIEALARDFSPLEDMSLSAHDINADKTMNSHLHLMEAYANLYRVWPDPSLKQALLHLIDLTCTRIMAPDGHLQLYFCKDWSVLPGAVSYGHDIETSWLLLESAFATHDLDVVSRVRPYALALGRAGNEGLMPDGSMRYELLTDGTFDDSRQWWVQAETVVGNLWLWKFHGDTAAADRALACWDYIRDNLVDREGGEWYWAILPDGTPDLSQPKAGFWKCPYHNSRMCLEIMKLFE